MNISELYQQYPESLTNIQFIELTNNYIGKEFEITGHISDISIDRIDIKEHSFTLIYYDSTKFGTKLLTFSKGNKVIIKGKLKEARYHNPIHGFSFSLIAIDKMTP